MAVALAQAMMQTIELMWEQQTEQIRLREEEAQAKEAIKPDQLDATPFAFPRWNLARSAYASAKRNNWVYELDDAAQEAHPNYQPDA